MKIHATASKENSIYHYTLFLLGIPETDTTTYPIVPFMRSANAWSRKAVFWIWKADASWEFDDSSHSDLPIATTTLVDNQQDYSIPTEALDILRIEVLDTNGDYQMIPQTDKARIGTGMTEHYGTAGMPVEYDLIANSIFLYPKPDTSKVTATKGLKVYLSRDIDAFVITDTSQEPGFNKSFHELVAYGPAYDFAIANGIVNKMNVLRPEIERVKKGIEAYHAKRSKDFGTKIIPKVRSSI